MKSFEDALVKLGFNVTRGMRLTTITRTLGEGEELKLYTDFNLYNVEINGEYQPTTVSSLLGLSILLKEKLGIPFNIDHWKERVTRDYIENLGFQKVESVAWGEKYKWESMFSTQDEIYLYLDLRNKKLVCTSKKGMYYHANNINEFEWFLECDGVLRILKGCQE